MEAPVNRTTLAITLIAASATGLGIATANAASPGVPATPQVLTILPNPPFEMRINGKLTGFDVQLANAVAKAAGIKALRWQPVQNLTAELQGVSTGQAPMAASSITITPERQKQMIFSTPYIDADLGVVTKKGSKLGANGVLQNLTVGVLKGSTSASYVDALPGNVVEVLYPTQTGAYNALLRGAVKVVLNDYAQSSWYVQNNSQDFTLAALIDQPGKIAFAFTKNQVQLRNAFNKGLAVVRHNGTLLRLKNKWIP
jgi:ABC-type amino acid transport substrate-binding protein